MRLSDLFLSSLRSGDSSVAEAGSGKRDASGPLSGTLPERRYRGATEANGGNIVIVIGSRPQLCNEKNDKAGKIET